MKVYHLLIMTGLFSIAGCQGNQIELMQQQHAAEKNELQEANVALQQKLATMEKEKAGVVEQKEELEGVNQTLSGTISALELQMAREEENVTRAELAISEVRVEAQKRADELTKELDAMKAQSVMFETDLAKAIARAESLEKQTTQSASTASGATETLKKVKANLTKALVRNNQLQSRITNLEKQLKDSTHSASADD
jgi:chromosome segregation ATPase